MTEQKTDARRAAWRWIGRGVMVAIVLAGLASCSATNQAKDAQPNKSGVTNPAPTNPAPTSPAATSPAPTPTGEGLCGFISTATLEKVLGGPIRSATLDKKTANNPTCYYESSTSAAGLTAYCAETGQILAGLRNGATDLDGSAPEAGNVNGKGRRVFTITEDGSCVLDLAVIRAADTSADTTKILAAGLLEAYNSAKVHKP